MDEDERWLLRNLVSIPVQAAVLNVWLHMSEMDRAVLRAMDPVIIEEPLKSGSGAARVFSESLDGTVSRRIIALNSRMTDIHWLSYTAAHEIAHVLLRHPDVLLGGGRDHLKEPFEEQADWLAGRWGFAPIEKE